MSVEQLRVPATAIARKGIGHLTDLAQDRTVLVTNHGKPVAVVESPAAHEARTAELKEAVDGVLGLAAGLVADRSSFVGAEEARKRLGR